MQRSLMMKVRRALLALACLALAGCIQEVPGVLPDAGVSDAGVSDAGEPDAGEPDAGEPDAGEPDAGLPPPALLQSLPEDGALEVDVLSSLSATFSGPGDSLPWSLESLGVLREGTPVAGEVELSARTVSFRPTSRLALRSRYTATVSLRVERPSGPPALQEYGWSFTTREGRWDAEAQAVSSEVLSAGHLPAFALGARGHAVAMWIHEEAGRPGLWANRYLPAVGWEGAVRVAPEDTGLPSVPQVVVDASGNALAVWARHDGSADSLWYSRTAAGQGWTPAAPVEPWVAGDSSLPQLATHADGSALLLWTRFNGIRETLWAARYLPGQGWMDIEQLDKDRTEDAVEPQLRLGAGGQGLAVWLQPGGARGRIRARRYLPGQGWAPAEEVVAEGGDVVEPRAALGPDGTAMLLWLQNEGKGFAVWSSRRPAGAGWEPARSIDIESTGFHSSQPQLAMDGEGHTLAVWVKYDGKFDGILSSRHVPGVGWGAPETVAPRAKAEDATTPVLAVDAVGNGLLVWRQSKGGPSWLASCRYAPGEGWGGDVLLHEGPGDSVAPQLYLAPEGHGFLFWGQQQGELFQLFTNPYK